LAPDPVLQHEFLAVAELLPGFVWSAAADGAPDYYNQQFLDYLGLGHADMHGWTWLEAVHPEDRQRTRDAWQQSLVSGAPYAIDFRLRSASDGSYRWFAARGRPHKDSQGRLLRWLGTVTDIHDRIVAHARDLAGRQALLHTIADTAPVYIAYCTPTLEYLFVNQAYAARFGCKPEDCVGLTIGELVGPRALERVRPYIDRALGGESVTAELDVPFDSGVQFLRYGFAPHLDTAGAVAGFVVVISDLTERRRMEDALRAADKHKDDFVAVLSHELRNHLWPMQAATTLLSTSGVPEDNRAKARDVIARQTQHLVRLVDDLLDLAKVGRGTLELVRQPFDLRDAVAGSGETVSSRVRQKTQRLLTDLPDTPVLIDGDRTRITQVVTNLLVNASKFSDEGGEIRVQLRAADGHAVITVDDDGPGIDPELLPRIFEPFIKGVNQRGEGLGLGLNIVHRLVQLHGGSVAAFSDGPGKGAQFVVTLPLEAR
jgi:PAS domain S-box-containing protein